MGVLLIVPQAFVLPPLTATLGPESGSYAFLCTATWGVRGPQRNEEFHFVLDQSALGVYQGIF